MPRRLAAVLTVAVLATVFAVPAPALAAAPGLAAMSQCPTNRLCLWDGTDYTGTAKDWAFPQSCNGIVSTFNDKAESAWNRTSRTIYLYENYGWATCGGSWLPLSPGTAYWNLGAVNFANKTSAFGP